MAISREQILAELEDVIRTMPARETIGPHTPEAVEWIGRACAVVRLWDQAQFIHFSRHAEGANSWKAKESESAVTAILVTLNQARHELRIQTLGPTTVAIGAGNVFDYFDEMRKTIELAKSDLLFVDPYLDAEFVSRYLPHVTAGVTVRLLGSQSISKLLPAAQALTQQTGLSIEVRSTGGLHDRYLFVDDASCYQSGASFKDGAKKSPTTLTQIIDAFTPVRDVYHQKWQNGTIHK